MYSDVVVIGGGPAGVVTATTAKRYYPEKSVTLVRKNEIALIPCGIPYMYGTLRDVGKNAMADEPLKKAGINIVIGEVKTIDLEKKLCIFADGNTIEYNKLVLATGSLPVVPRSIKGTELNGVYTVQKDAEYHKRLMEDIERAEKVVIVGGGFIGVEFADEISKLGKKVTIVELLPHCLMAAFDDEFCVKAEEKLKERGIEIVTGVSVERIEGDGKAEDVKLSDGREISADVVIVSIGARPNSDIAKEAGLAIGQRGGIIVDEYMRTSNSDVFAVGDCAEKRDFFTRKISPIMLASTATAEARIAGSNLFRLEIVREYAGTIGVFSTCIGNLALANVGLTESQAKREGFEIVVGRATAIDRHPGSIPDATKIEVKLVVSKCGIVLGGQLCGGKSVGELINMLGMAVENKMTLTEIMTLQIGTHPLLTPAPTIYPVIMAAQDALSKL